MKSDYSDIIDAMKSSGKNILWYDFNGVPRYEEYHPNLGMRNVNITVLLLAECQDCKQQFYTEFGEYTRSETAAEEFFKRFESPFANVFDPPWDAHTEECTSGRSMTSTVIEVVGKYRLINGVWNFVK